MQRGCLAPHILPPSWRSQPSSCVRAPGESQLGFLSSEVVPSPFFSPSLLFSSPGAELFFQSLELKGVSMKSHKHTQALAGMGEHCSHYVMNTWPIATGTVPG